MLDGNVKKVGENIIRVLLGYAHVDHICLKAPVLWNKSHSKSTPTL